MDSDQSDEDRTVRTATCRLTECERRIQIMCQLEFYLSDANLSRDKLFSRQIQERADHGVPISLLLNCNKLVSLGIERTTLIDVVRHSSSLRLSENSKCSGHATRPVQCGVWSCHVHGFFISFSHDTRDNPDCLHQGKCGNTPEQS